ncbi:MAG: RHS repeat-associated core domain-containing protein, partial [Bdellovibrionia bacterium]
PGYVKNFKYQADGKPTEMETIFTGWKTVIQKLTYHSDGTPHTQFLVTKNQNEAQANSSTNSLGSKPSISGVTQEYLLDSAGRVSKLKVNSSDLFTLSYDGLSQVKEIELSRNTDFKFEYDSTTNRLKSFASKLDSDTANNSWNFNNRGLITSEVLAFKDKILNRQYQYSLGAKLAHEQDEDSTRTYNYSPVGILKKFSVGQATHEISEIGNSWTLKSGENSSAYMLDELGRVTKIKDTLLAYGPSGRVETVEAPGQPAIQYSYDETGKRILKKQNGRILEAYVNGIVITDDTTFQPIEINGMVLGVLENQKFIPLPIDLRGSVMQNGKNEPDFVSTYGERNDSRTVAAYAKLIDYVAQGYDEDLKAYRMDQRDYDPVLKRFLTPDLLFIEDPTKCFESPGECNLYSYAGGNPVSFVDPEGEAQVHVWDSHFDPKTFRYSVGHTSMTLNDGTYISFWPKHEERIDAIRHTSGEGKFIQSKEIDIAKEGSRAPSHNYQINGLNEKQIKEQFLVLLKNEPNYDLYKYNCSSLVKNLVDTAGANLDHSFITRPESIKDSLSTHGSRHGVEIERINTQ